MRESGSILPPSVTSTQGTMLVRFVSDYYETGFGVVATYSSGILSFFILTPILIIVLVSVPTSATYMCRPGAFTTYVPTNIQSGTLRSTGCTANEYLPYLDCSFIITAPVNKKVSLQFTAFGTEECCDSVRVLTLNN